MRPFGQQCSFRFCCILSFCFHLGQNICSWRLRLRPSEMNNVFIVYLLDAKQPNTKNILKILAPNRARIHFFVFLGVYSLILIIVWNGERVTAHVGERWKSTAHRLMFGVYIRHDSSSGVYLSIIFPNIFALFKRREKQQQQKFEAKQSRHPFRRSSLSHCFLVFMKCIRAYGMLFSPGALSCILQDLPLP